MSAVAQLLIEFIAQDSARALEFTLWMMTRGDFSLPAKAACLMLKIEAMKQLDGLNNEANFTAEALAQAQALLGGDE